MEYRDVNGMRMRCDWQRGDGIPLLLCDGWGSNIEVLDSLTEALAGRSVVRFDIPGFGGSQLSRWPLRLPAMAAMLEAMLGQLGIGRFDVAGYSWGGTLAQELAKRNPERVRRLILLATSTGHVMVPARPKILWAFTDRGWITNWRHPNRFFERDFACRVGPKLFGGERLARDPATIVPVLEKLQRPTVKSMLWQVAGTVGWTSLPWIRRLTQPTLVLAGTDDRVVHPLNPILLRRLIPRARLEWVRGGHLFPVLDAPVETADRIAHFVDEGNKVVRLDARRKRVTQRAL